MEQMDLTIFDLSPIAMWLQDFSGIKKIFDDGLRKVFPILSNIYWKTPTV